MESHITTSLLKVVETHNVTSQYKREGKPLSLSVTAPWNRTSRF
jgi:hypothetical protein